MVQAWDMETGFFLCYSEEETIMYGHFPLPFRHSSSDCQIGWPPGLWS
jgi:hypothetical protein